MPLCQVGGPEARQAILDFVEGVTIRGGPDFAAAADRIAAFDNDGTPCGWSSRCRPQFDFVFGTWAREIKQDPTLAAQQPYKSDRGTGPGLLPRRRDPGTGGHRRAAGRVRAVLGRHHPALFEAQVREWMATVQHPTLGVPTWTWSTNPCWSCSTC
jgi:hypothetical protein